MKNFVIFGCATMAVALALAGLIVPATIVGGVMVWLIYREIGDE